MTHYPRSLIDQVLIKVTGLLAPHCETLTAAGSYRRGKPTSRDLDLVATPKAIQQQGDMFGGGAPVARSPITDALVAFRNDGFITFTAPPDEPPGKLGDRMARFWVIDEPVPIDLYVVLPPAVHAIILAIRTGSVGWNAAMMSWMQRTPFSIKDGALHVDGERIEHQPVNERDLYNLLGLRHVEPPLRETMADFIEKARPR